MKTTVRRIRFKRLATLAAKLMAEKKCEDIQLIDVKSLTSLCDYFLIATVESVPQMDATVEEIITQFKKKKIQYLHYEASDNKKWSVIDYGGLIVHLMFPDIRDYYSLDKVWSRGKFFIWGGEKFDKKKNKGSD